VCGGLGNGPVTFAADCSSAFVAADSNCYTSAGHLQLGLVACTVEACDEMDDEPPPSDRFYRLSVVVVDLSASVWPRHRKLCCTSVASDCG
jgi:hypothetical protein